uniref:heparosan-N-sulfate-glucuronate 5-epimerase n=1 Tax=Acrobeloides nanus TaxID=290746 RepID=A0A914CSA0_9BILA
MIEFSGAKKIPYPPHFLCFRDENDIYLPFEKFIRKQFEATGRVVKDGLDQRFEYFTSYAKIRLPDFITYDPFSFFGHFGSYNVEIRERVRCISAEFGVPMSTQWDSIPYFYPIQIAQFALQHYSRNLTDKPPKVKSIQLDQLIEQEHAMKKDESSVKITSSENGVIIALDDDPSFTVLIFSWIPENDDAAFSVTITDRRSHRTVKLMYKFVEDRRCVWPNIETDDYNEDNRKQEELVFTYSLGKRDHFSFQTIVRDILIDTSKALALVEPVSVRKDGTQNGGLKTGDITLLSLKFYGDCTIRAPIKQQTKAHHEMFLRASEWFLKNQDSQGGWAVPVQRTIADNQLVLAAGWHSAMAQGHALSVLTRAFHATQDSRFIEAGEKALHLFNKVKH